MLKRVINQGLAPVYKRQVLLSRPIALPSTRSFSPYTRLYSSKTSSKVDETQESEEFEVEDEEYTMDVTNLPSRWLRLSGEDQLDIINYLNVKQQFGWNFLTPDEKKAIYYISYGDWGPRNQQSLNLPEMIFRIMSISILFGVVGFSLINYATDKGKVNELEGGVTSELGNVEEGDVKK
ncbi:hypothetical protein CANARDRAFT_29688 [[Candida] arabinofermentans NRRL YB-2248]|uniref:Uncharacterized protein n=1 Tax=[Candida] arabinofermentans NRRL YB-2248 TaxID=983967 RepID=A0A1E4SW08_9ASCO|nr:hypothetical protein CANARDRAFT_29688 [[Candida] arabinofermentans NRRL YB-2248]